MSELPEDLRSPIPQSRLKNLSAIFLGSLVWRYLAVESQADRDTLVDRINEVLDYLHLRYRGQVVDLARNQPDNEDIQAIFGNDGYLPVNEYDIDSFMENQELAKLLKDYNFRLKSYRRYTNKKNKDAEDLKMEHLFRMEIFAIKALEWHQSGSLPTQPMIDKVVKDLDLE